MTMDLAVREADGVMIRFSEAGRGGRETAILTSPWPESLLALRKVWDRLAERFHLVAIDLPGFGQSERHLDLLAPFYDAIGGGAPPPNVRDDYLEPYAGDRFVESCRFVRTYPTELPKLAEKLSGIETPAQIVCGRDDPIVPMANQEFLREKLPNNRIDLLDAGHFAWEEVPDLYGGVLSDWLNGGYRELLGT